MRAIIPEVPASLIAWRKTTGADRWDEVWDGVVHMPPMPNREHQDLEFGIEAWLRTHWAPEPGARVYHQINVASPGGWPTNYRIPDVVLLTPNRFEIDRNEYFEGAPDVVVEIRSRGDESYEKLQFYAAIGVPEVWIIDRDSKSPEVNALAGVHYVRQIAGPNGWSLSPYTGVELKATANKLSLRLANNEESRQDLP